MILAQEGYRDEEYEVPKNIFEEAGMEVITGAKAFGTCTGKLGGSVEATVSIDDLNVSEYDAIVFIPSWV